MLSAAARLGNAAFNSPPTLSAARLEHHWLTSETALGFLADYYACAERPYRLPGVAGQVAKSRSTFPSPQDLCRYGTGKDILYVPSQIARGRALFKGSHITVARLCLRIVSNEIRTISNGSFID